MSGCPLSRFESLGVYLPPREVSTQEVVDGCASRLRFPLARLTGIRARRMAGETEFSIDLARAAARDCLARSRYRAADVDVLVCCNISRCDGPGLRFTVEPSTAVRLKGELGLSRAAAFDLSNACAGMFTGVLVADAMLRAGLVRRALVVSGEYITHLTRTAQRELVGTMDPRVACLTLGDAGAALLLDRAEDARSGLHDIDIHTLAQYAHLCVGKPSRESDGMIMHTDSLELTVAGLKPAAEHARQVLTRHGWNPAELPHLIMHQTSKTTLAEACRELNASYGRQVAHARNTVVNLEERGNTASTTHVLALRDRVLQGLVKPGDRVAFGITGSGLSVGTALYTMDELALRLGRPPAEPPTSSSSGGNATSPEGCRGPAEGALAPMRVVRAAEARAEGAAETVELACRAVRACLGEEPREVDLLLFAGVYRTDFVAEPAIATFIAQKLGLHAGPDGRSGHRTLAFDVLNGGLGFFDACWVAQALIGAGKARRAVVVTSEVENNRGLAGEAVRGIEELAAAALLETDPERGFGALHAWHFPEGASWLDAHTAQRNGRTVLEVERSSRLDDESLQRLAMGARWLCEQERLPLSAVQWVLAPQVSSEFLRALAQRLELPEQKMVDAVRGRRDLFTASLPAGFAALERCGSARPGDRALVLQMGAGFQVGGAVYRL